MNHLLAVERFMKVHEAPPDQERLRLIDAVAGDGAALLDVTERLKLGHL
jgi:hypothetical protein